MLKGATEGRAFLADPSRGHLRIPLHQLFQQWSGETLTLGREGFGLPRKHGMQLPASHAVAPERATIRALQHTPLN